MKLAIRHTLPALLLLVSATMVVFYYTVTMPNLTKETTGFIEDRALAEVRSLQGRLNSDLYDEADRQFSIELFYAAANTLSQGLYIANAAGEILYADRSRVVGKTIDALAFTLHPDLIEKAREGGATFLGPIDKETGWIAGYAGLTRTVNKETERLALIYIIDFRSELDQLQALARRPSELTIGLLTALSLFLAVAFRFYLDTRQSALFKALYRLQDGEVIENEEFQSGDEFSEIGLGLANVSQTLVQDRQELDYLRKQSETLGAARQRLIDKYSLDLRPPVTAVQGHLHALSELELPPEARSHIEDGYIAAKVLAGLTGDLMEADRTGLDQYWPQLEPVCPPILFQTLYDAAAPFARLRNKQLKLNGSLQDTIWFNADLLLIRSFLLHVLKEVFLLSDDQHVDLSYDYDTTDNSMLAVNIAIRANFLPDTFEPITSTTGSSQKSDISERLGDLLDIDLISLIRKQGSDITLYSGGRSDPDEIAIRVVGSRTARQENLDDLITTLTAKTKLDILLIEPDMAANSFCKQVLEKAGHRVTATGSAKEAKQSIQDNAIYSANRMPNMLLVTLDMPLDTSAVLISQLRAMDEQIRTIPIIGISALHQHDHAMKEHLGLTSILYRPFDASQLVLAVDYVVKFSIL